MSVVCCGQPRTSRFCPDCGKQLAGDPLMELLIHCRISEKKQRTQAENFRDCGKPDDPGRKEAVESRTMRADVWKARADALVKLMDERNDTLDSTVRNGDVSRDKP